MYAKVYMEVGSKPHNRRFGGKSEAEKGSSMKPINTSELINACDKVAHHCTTICGTHHGSAWLFDKLMREFTKCDALEAITIPVFINAPVMAQGEAEIGRDGHCYIVRK